MTTSSPLAHVVVPSNIVAMMTGCRQVSKHGEIVTAHYTDGTEESVWWPEYDIYVKKDEFFSLVGDIQQKARSSPHQEE